MIYVLLFLAGALLCNCIPHLAAGLLGMPFPTPFATPRGIGNSPPLMNFLWGTFNLGVGVVLVSRYPIALGVNPYGAAFAAGFLVLGVYLSRHFGKVRGRT